MTSEARDMVWFEISRSMGRIKIVGTCPFCGATVHGFLWSVCGSGKRCTCRALLTSVRALPPKAQSK